MRAYNHTCVSIYYIHTYQYIYTHIYALIHVQQQEESSVLQPPHPPQLPMGAPLLSPGMSHCIGCCFVSEKAIGEMND